MSQNFLSYAGAITDNVDLDVSVRETIQQLHGIGLDPSTNVLWINGALYDMKDKSLTIHRLLHLLITEKDLITRIQSLGMICEDARRFLTSYSDIFFNPLESSTDDEHHFYILYDDLDSREHLYDHIIWLNDLETDPEYAHWPDEILLLTQPVYNLGQTMFQLRLNLFSAVFVLDLTKPSSVNILKEQILVYVQSQIPVRFGVVILAHGEENIDDLAWFYAVLSDKKTRDIALKFVKFSFVELTVLAFR